MGKITEQELNTINSLKQQSIEVASALGELCYQNILIESQIDLLKEKIADIKKQETSLFEELKASYGNVTINIETGEFK